jgi:NAD(P)-dependent dehydrogenase (short-subunit alcohol dehydrogenase family)
MSSREGALVVVGGTAGLGRELAQQYSDRGLEVVITGRDAARAQSVAAEIGGNTRGIGFDLEAPRQIAQQLSGLATVDFLVLAAIQRDQNSVRAYDIDAALRLVTLKLVGYTEVVRCLAPQMHEHSAVLLFGGLAKDRPYPGSTTVTSVNGAVTSMVRAFALELAPVRVNALHPGIVGDSPFWAGKDEMLRQVQARTPTGRLTTMSDIADAARFLLENPAVNGVNLVIDGGTILM